MYQEIIKALLGLEHFNEIFINITYYLVKTAFLCEKNKKYFQ